MLGGSAPSDDWRLALMGGDGRQQRRASRFVDGSLLFRDGGGAGQQRQLDHREFMALTKSLSMPTEAVPSAVAPATVTDGVASGYLMHQGKFRGAWKKAWFVLKPPHLYQYASERSAKPKAAFYVSFAMAEKLTLGFADDEAFWQRLVDRRVLVGNR